MKKLRTAEDVCIEYAIAHAAVTEQTRILRDTKCEVAEEGEAADWDTNYPGMAGTPSCLDNLFGAPKGPDGEFPRWQEFYDKMCEPCKVKLAAVEARKDAKRRFGAAKRGVEAVGKRLNHATTVAQSCDCRKLCGCSVSSKPHCHYCRFGMESK